MIPLLIAAAVGATAWFVNKPGGRHQAIVQTNPGNAGTGITTGFAAPQVQTANPPSSSSTQSNTPNAASSGIPGYASQAYNTTDSNPHPIPAGTFGPMFYQGTNPSNQPWFQNQGPPISSTVSTSGGASCGCGGGRHTCDSQGLAANTASQIAASNPSQLASYFHALEGQGFQPGVFGVYQHAKHASEDAAFAPGGSSDHTPPASPWQTPIGFTASGVYGQ